MNHLNMNDIRAEIYAADEAADDEKIAEGLIRLQKFASNHTIINIIEKNGVNYITFGTGPIYLERQYLRKATEALEAAQANAGDDSNPNGNVFAKAMDVCKPQAIAYGWSWNSQPYLDCMTGEIAKYPTSDFIQDGYDANLPSTREFRYDFVSPVWKFDLAGLVFLCIILVSVITFLRVLIWIIARVYLFFAKN